MCSKFEFCHLHGQRSYSEGSTLKCVSLEVTIAYQNSKTNHEIFISFQVNIGLAGHCAAFLLTRLILIDKVHFDYILIDTMHTTWL